MNENVNPGGAAPALAAHSKDASAQGQTSASSTLGEQPIDSGVRGAGSGVHEATGEGVEGVKASVREAASNARDALVGQSGRAVDQTTNFIRQQPLAALAVTGVVCLVLGVLLGRR